MTERMLDAARLILRPDPKKKPGRFSARLETTGEIIIGSSRQPLVDGARELLARGFDPATPLTMRHEDSLHDSFRPLPIGTWAGWTYEEGERTALQRRPWRPFAAGTGPQKSGSEPGVAPGGHSPEIHSYGGPAQHHGGVA